MEVPQSYVGRGRVQGSAWQSPEQIKKEREKKEQEDESKTVPFEEFVSKNGKITIFRQIPYSATTHKKANAYIELFENRIEKVIIFFMKKATCNEFCDLVRRQILNGVFKSYELELFLADDDGKFDDKNEPPPSNEILAKIIDIGLDSFYFKIANSWQLSSDDKQQLINKINQHKKQLNIFEGNLEDGNNNDSDDDSDSDDDGDGDNDANNNNNNENINSNDKEKEKNSENSNINQSSQNGGNSCCIIL